MFNAFNISNLTGNSTGLDVSSNPSAVCAQGSVTLTNNPNAIACEFGQATGRAGQTFGSSGPRAVQIGARFTF